MKKSLFILAIAMLTLAMTVNAHEDESDFNQFLGIDTEDLTQEQTIEAQKAAIFENLDSVGMEVNKQLKEMPGIVKSVVSNTNVNVYFEDNSVVGVTFLNGKISTLQNGALENPTFNVYISDNVFVYLNNGNLDLKEAIKNGDISYKGVGFAGKMKSAFLTTILTLIGM